MVVMNKMEISVKDIVRWLNNGHTMRNGFLLWESHEFCIWGQRASINSRIDKSLIECASCGGKTEFENGLSPPDQCDYCGRWIIYENN